jgi:2,3-bisphosphoglycerate-dependent phosphoglycerate mutase
MNTTNDATKDPKQQPSMSKRQNSKGNSSFGKLIFIRHAESEWNALGKWTGRTDVHITEEGHNQAAKLGEAIKDIDLHHAYTSEQIRTIETFVRLMETAENNDIPHERSAHLNERDYGDYTGLNKWDVLEQLGEDIFTQIRRAWDHPIPNGETMKMVHERAVPFYKEHILPKLLEGKNVLIVSHGNTIRSLIKYLEDISDEGIAEVEMSFGEILIYHVTDEGKHHSKELRKIDITPPKA